MNILLLTLFLLIIITVLKKKSPDYIVTKKVHNKGFEIRYNGNSVYVHITDEKLYNNYMKEMLSGVTLPKHKEINETT